MVSKGLMNKVQQEDINLFAQQFTDREKLSHSTFLITGATGLIGSTLCFCLMQMNRDYHTDIHLLCPVRNRPKAEKLFEGFGDYLTIFSETLTDFIASYEHPIDYIIHCASPTNSRYMVSNPVETYTYTIETTLQLLRYACQHPVKGMVYISSLEYYGESNQTDLISEDYEGYVNASSPRSSYPMGKRAAEYACFAYAAEYHVPVKIARLTQTFGAGISANDNRVFAQFMRAAIQGKDIILKSSGMSSKPYCYTTDTASGILFILLRGKNGDAYNVSNDNTYISINDMAQLVRDHFAKDIKIIHDFDPNSCYAPDTLLHLSSAKLQALGWQPKYNLLQMYERLYLSLKES